MSPVLEIFSIYIYSRFDWETATTDRSTELSSKSSLRQRVGSRRAFMHLDILDVIVCKDESFDRV